MFSREAFQRSLPWRLGAAVASARWRPIGRPGRSALSCHTLREARRTSFRAPSSKRSVKCGRPAVHHRKSARRRHDGRDQRQSSEGRSGRPHDPGALQCARHRPSDPSECALRSGARLLRYHAARQRAVGARDLAREEHQHRSRSSSRSQGEAREMNYAAAGIGTPPHLTTERFRLAAGMEGQLVPFKGAPEALTEVITGRVDFYFCPIRLRCLCCRTASFSRLRCSSSKRAVALPNVPTTVEAGVPDSDSRLLGRRLPAEGDAA